MDYVGVILAAQRPPPPTQQWTVMDPAADPTAYISVSTADRVAPGQGFPPPKGV